MILSNKQLIAGLIFLSITISCSQSNRLTDPNEFDNGSKITSIQLSNIESDDLVIVGQLWGFLKYYHPLIATGNYDWDYELFRILPKILETSNKDQRNNVLSDWVSSIGEINHNEKTEIIDTEIKINPDLSWIDKMALGDKLVEQLILIKNAERFGDNKYVGLMPVIGNPEFKNENAYASMSYPDAGYRLLSLYRYWNIINYYFPYKYLIGEDWNKVLHEYIPHFINATDELDYKLTVLKLIGRVHDTHANIWGNDSVLYKYRGQKYASLEVSIIENEAIVTDYIDDSLGFKTGLEIGDIIENIDGVSVESIVKERLPLTPASNYPTQLRDIARNLLRTNNSSIEVSYSNGGTKQTKRLTALSAKDAGLYTKYYKRDTCFRIIEGEIGYLFPGSVKNEYLPKIMSIAKNTKGLIIDFRCYPSDFITFSLSEYLLPESNTFVKLSIGSTTTPGLFTMNNELQVGRKNPEYYKGKIVIIVNELTQSTAEYHTMAFRTAPNSIVIGSTTAGADGNVSQFFLPGGISTSISGIGVYYPDGKETQRIGIVPDIEVKPTIKGIRERKDEPLEMAIKLINSE